MTITGHSFYLLGLTILTLQIGQEKRTAEFQVLHPFFLAPHDEILEKPFVIDL